MNKVAEEIDKRIRRELQECPDAKFIFFCTQCGSGSDKIEIELYLPEEIDETASMGLKCLKCGATAFINGFS